MKDTIGDPWLIVIGFFLIGVIPFGRYPPPNARSWAPFAWMAAGWMLLAIVVLKLNGHITSDVVTMGLIGLSNVEDIVRQWRNGDRARRGLRALADKLSVFSWLLLTGLGAMFVPTCVMAWREGGHGLVLGVSALMVAVGAFLMTRRVERASSLPSFPMTR